MDSKIIDQKLNLLEYLKQETESDHRLAEKNNTAKYILDHTITSDQYISLLLNNYMIYNGIESYLVNNKHLAHQNLVEFISKEKSDLLKFDLESHGCEVNNNNPLNTFLKPSPESIVGALYVLEGSMLGGLVIGKNLNKCQNLTAFKEHYFYNQDTTYCLSRWKHFCESVKACNYDYKDFANISQAASAVFRRFH